MKTSWLLRCASGKEFVVYAWTAKSARTRFTAMMPEEKVLRVDAHDADAPTGEVVDRRAAPGA